MSFGKYAIVIKEPFGRLVRGGTSLCHKVEVLLYNHTYRIRNKILKVYSSDNSEGSFKVSISPESW